VFESSKCGNDYTYENSGAQVLDSKGMVLQVHEKKQLTCHHCVRPFAGGGAVLRLPQTSLSLYTATGKYLAKAVIGEPAVKVGVLWPEATVPGLLSQRVADGLATARQELRRRLARWVDAHWAGGNDYPSNWTTGRYWLTFGY